MTTWAMILLCNIMMWAVQVVTASTNTPCQGIALLGGKYNISTEIIFDRFVWVRPGDNQNVVTCNPVCSAVSPYTATQKNAQNISTLMMERVQIKDVGTWTVTDAASANMSVCHLHAAGLPTCIITSSLSHDSLEPDSELTLVAGIRGYYCSRQLGFELTAGRDVPDVLLKNNTVTGLTDIVLNTTFNVTLKRLGNVRMDFTCYNSTYTLPCQGTIKLFKSPPECDISSSRNGPLIPGTNLTLTVNITSYYCTEEAAFDLITGSVRRELLQVHHVADISSAVVSKTFELTSEQDGDIKVNFNCDGTSRELTCDGDTMIDIVKPATSTTPPPTPATVPVYLIIGIVAALLVVLIIIFVLIVCRKSIARVARKYIVTKKRPQIRNLRENDKPNKGKRMSQINPDKKADFENSVHG